ncbi:unnamed protein product [Clonostachys rhizophaga]|uniref:Uncharacterized protein n=1 Tax=Clonostachys rhizophaga TaxID=160324 RepID=A0A9N9YTZ3_9HYPO|nr:unnamed protein product [Clonostachys rhizophaga]
MALFNEPSFEALQANTPNDPQFNVLNTAIFPTETDCLDQSQPRLTEFHQFSRFPTEIQLRILELTQSPKTKRLVTILLMKDPRVEEESQSSCPQNSLQRYRIRLPMNPGNPNNEYLYLDPENDTLYLDSFGVPPSTLVGFFHDLRAYDKQGSGLWNLAINMQCVEHLKFLHLTTPEILRPEEVRSFKQSLMTLEHLWFIHLLNKDNRYMGLPPAQRSSRLGSFTNYRRPVTHAMPLFPEASEFYIMPADPRLLKRSDFERVRFWKEYGPMGGLFWWESMETKFGMTAENESLPQREISYVIAVDATEDHTVCSQDCHDRCGEDVVRSISSLKTYLVREEHQAPCQIGSLEGIEKGQEVSVAGFWVFPIDVLDEQEPRHAGVPPDMDVVDFSNRSPALGVFYLPKGLIE